MADTPDERPRPTPHARPTRPTPRPRVAGSRRDRDEVAPVSRPVAPAAASSRRAAPSPAPPSSGRRISALTLARLCAASAAGLSVLLWIRSRTTYVDPSLFSAASSDIQALYAYDYKDSEGSVQGKLDVPTGELRDEYETDLSQGGIIDTY